MGEHYWGDLVIEIPANLPAPTGTPSDPDATLSWDLGPWMIGQFGITDEDALTKAQAARLAEVRELLEEIEGWVCDAESFDITDRCISVGGEHNYGIAFWTENTELEVICKKHGIAYRMWDEGKYEIPGEERVWEPAGEVKCRGYSAAGTVLPANEAEAMFKAAGEDLAAFGAFVRDYFA